MRITIEIFYPTAASKKQIRQYRDMTESEISYFLILDVSDAYEKIQVNEPDDTYLPHYISNIKMRFQDYCYRKKLPPIEQLNIIEDK